MISCAPIPTTLVWAEDEVPPVSGEEESSAAKLPPDVNMESTPAEPEATPVPEGEPTLPERPSPEPEAAPIEAKAYDLKTVRPSKSNRVYLFEKEVPEYPEIGRIFLLKDNESPVMAFRTLRIYPDTKQIAAKKIRTYPGKKALAPDSTYRAFEKVGDLVVTRPSEEDLSDLAELESQALPALPAPEGVEGRVNAPSGGAKTEVDESGQARGAAPGERKNGLHEKKEVDETADEIDEEEDEIKESGIFDYFPNMISTEFNFIRNTSTPGSTLKTGVSLRYARAMNYRIFQIQYKKPDSLWIEGGLSYFTASGDGESLTIMPITGALRYDAPLNETVSFFVYGGLVYNAVVGETGASKADQAKATGFAPALGVGTMIQTGPNWYIRVNLGLDNIGFGLVLKF